MIMILFTDVIKGMQESVLKVLVGLKAELVQVAIEVDQ